MVNSLVERATSDMLIGPDWAMNIEISDMLNRDPGQVKDIVKGIKRRIGSKNPKVQLLALTLLETIIKNSGDIVHMQVAEKNVLHEMVKIVKKKPDYQVKEKILVLIDTWQEAFGGPRARYPQYYAAYQELLRTGAVFPQRSERVAPIFTPPQSHPLSSYPQNVQDSAFSHDDARPESSTEAEYPTLSLSEMQNARGSMDVLAEMLNAIDPGNKEGLRQEALVDLVEQCRTYKQRVVHLVNSTMDESMLSQGLALNDDLQRVLAKYEAVISGVSAEADKSKPEPAIRDLVAVDTGESSKQTNERSTLGANTSTTLVPVSAPPVANGSTLAPKADLKMDLLSGDLLGGDFDSSPAQNSLALVPVSAPQPASPVAFGNNALALVDMFSEGSSAQTPSNGPPPFSTGSEFQKQPHLYSQQASLYQNGMPSNIGSPYEQSAIPQVPNPFSGGSEFQKQPHLYTPNGMPSNIGSPSEQSAIPQVPTPAWSAQSAQLQQQPSSPAYGTQNGSSLPPPPWESQPTEAQTSDSPNPPTMHVSTISSLQSPQMQPAGLPTAGNEQIPGMFMQQPVTNQSFQMPVYPQHMQGGQMPGFIPQPMQPTQMTSMYPQPTYGNQVPGYGYQMGGYSTQMGGYGNQMGGYGNQMAGYGHQMAGYGYGGYGHQQDAQYLEQRMYGLSVKDDSASSRTSMASYLPPMKKQSNGDDKLFGDLVDMAKIKPTKTPPGRAGSM